MISDAGSFVLALALGNVVMIAGAAIYYFLVASPVTDADLEASAPCPASGSGLKQTPT